MLAEGKDLEGKVTAAWMPRRRSGEVSSESKNRIRKHGGKQTDLQKRFLTGTVLSLGGGTFASVWKHSGCHCDGDGSRN